MAKSKQGIVILKHKDGYDAYAYGITHRIYNADSAEEAVGLLVMLLSHPLGIKIFHETAEETEE